MSSMYFKDILIADIQKHTARYESFSKGLNVVTGEDNHVGKSSLVKSLYYTLGAEVAFDDAWSKSSKINIVTIDVDGEEYKIVRFLRKFAIFNSHRELILITDSVTKELAPMLGKMFDFSVFLADKSDAKKVVQAPPAFTFMPYYIDQDSGWTGLYESFGSLDQFNKPERIKSLYFHLGLYNKYTVEQMGKRDRLKEEVEESKERENKIRVTLEALNSEIENLIPAENAEELEKHLTMPKEKIEKLVEEIGQSRNRIQKLQTSLQQHEYQQEVIQEYKKIKIPEKKDDTKLHVCPRCGYEYDEELYALVRDNYSRTNEEYLLQQMAYIINSIKENLTEEENKYVALMERLKEQESVYDESQDAYELYIRQRGLKETIKKLHSELADVIVDQRDKEEEIKKIDKEIKKLPDKKEIEEIYIENVRANILKLSAWDSAYEGKIKLLKPIVAQGSLEGKIILSQYIGLFQTMEAIQSGVIRFPFVVDSPRGKESSNASSKEILTLIAKLKSLPQVILATVDYDKFDVQTDDQTHYIRLKEKRKLLNESTYSERADQIEGYYELLSDINL